MLNLRSASFNRLETVWLPLRGVGLTILLCEFNESGFASLTPWSSWNIFNSIDVTFGRQLFRDGHAFFGTGTVDNAGGVGADGSGVGVAGAGGWARVG